MAKPGPGGRNPRQRGGNRAAKDLATAFANDPKAQQFFAQAAAKRQQQQRSDPNDPDVYIGTGQGARRVGGLGRGAPVTRKASEVSNEYWGLNERELREFQEKAYRAGLYGGTPRAMIRFGEHDEDTARIWGTVVGRAALMYTHGGQRVSPAEVLDKAVETAEREGIAKTGPSLANPDDLRLVFSQVASQTAGIIPDEETIAAMVSAYHAKAGVEGQIQPPSAEAFAIGEINRRMPEETTTHAARATYREFINAMEGPV